MGILFARRSGSQDRHIRPLARRRVLNLKRVMLVMVHRMRRTALLMFVQCITVGQLLNLLRGY